MNIFFHDVLREEAGEGTDGSNSTSVEETEETTETEETEEESTEETEEEESEEEETEEEEEEEDPDAANALALFKLLKNPDTQKSVIETLARQAGLIETKQDVRKATDAIEEILTESLGEEFNFLAKKLVPGIKKILELQKVELSQDISSIATNSQQMQVTNEVERAVNILRKETKGEIDRYMPAIEKLADKYSPSEKVSALEYLRGLYKMASAGVKEGSAKRKIAEQINRNANDIGARTGSKSGSGNAKPGQNKLMTLDEAIKYAMKQHKLE